MASGAELVGSVMDYAPINIAPKGVKQGDYFSTTLGPYDYWAIEYAYASIDGDEASGLKKIASRAAEADLTFATDEDSSENDDPYVNVWDLGTDPCKFAEDRIAPVVMLTAFSQRELIDRARDAGVMAYVVKPFDASDVVPAIELAMARFAEIRQLDDEVADLEDRLETRKAVDQAKGILQEGLGLSEAEAFRWIQKTAMDLRLSMRQVADGVITHGPGIAGG